MGGTTILKGFPRYILLYLVVLIHSFYYVKNARLIQPINKTEHLIEITVSEIQLSL